MIGSDSTVRGGITSVITQLISHNWENEGIDMRFIPTFIETKKTKKTIFFLFSFIKILISFITYRPHIVHMHMSYRGSFHRKYIIQRLCKLFRKKNIIHLHGSEFEEFYTKSNNNTKKKIRKLLKECNSLIVLGEEWEKIIKNIEPTTKTIVVYNTVHIPKKNVSYKKTSFNILFTGVLIKRKGVNDLLTAMSLLKNEGYIDRFNIHLFIAGNGPEEIKLKELSRELGLDYCIEFLGWTSGNDKQELIGDSQLFIMPSYNEGLPIAILEAISYGMPVISTKVGSINEAVINKKNGYLIDPGNVYELKNSIVKICSNEKIWNDFSIASKQLATKKFSEKSYFNKLANLYELIK